LHSQHVKRWFKEIALRAILEMLYDIHKKSRDDKVPLIVLAIQGMPQDDKRLKAPCRNIIPQNKIKYAFKKKNVQLEISNL